MALYYNDTNSHPSPPKGMFWFYSGRQFVQNGYEIMPTNARFYSGYSFGIDNREIKCSENMLGKFSYF